MTPRVPDFHQSPAAHAAFATIARAVEVDGTAEDTLATFERLAREGNKVIFATSFGYGDAIFKVAKKYPDVKFEWATGYKTAKNVGTYFGAAEEGRYLSGIAAGAASASGKIGYVAAFPIPEVLRGINAFTLGAQSVNPNATVQVVWTSTWFGPDKEKQAAESLLAAGADVLAQHLPVLMVLTLTLAPVLLATMELTVPQTSMNVHHLLA